MPLEEIDLTTARVRVRTAGAGARSVLFAVDPPNTLEMYGPLFARLKPHARVAAFEAPGFGGSKLKRGGSYDLDAQAANVVELLERLDLAPAVLAFPCVSAYAALRVAALRPDLVSGLVLIQAPSWQQEVAWVGRVDPRGVLRTPGLGQAVVFLRAESIARKWYRAAAGDPAKGAHMSAMALESLSHGARFPLASAFQALFRGEAPVLAPVGCPTLAVWGDADRSHKRSDPASVRAHAPGAQVATIEGAGHFPELERPDAFSETLLAWMRRPEG